MSRRVKDRLDFIRQTYFAPLPREMKKRIALIVLFSFFLVLAVQWGVNFIEINSSENQADLVLEIKTLDEQIVIQERMLEKKRNEYNNATTEEERAELREEITQGEEQLHNYQESRKETASRIHDQSAIQGKS